jgi:hypothetical protein
MYGLNQIGSTLRDFIDAVLMIAALPEGARQKVRLAGLTAVGSIVSLCQA